MNIGNNIRTKWTKNFFRYYAIVAVRSIVGNIEEYICPESFYVEEWSGMQVGVEEGQCIIDVE